MLLVKTAWGGKSLYKDFRPPSSGGEVGPYYTKMIAEVREALANLKTDFPAYAGQGYELAGFVWYHGWNDGVDPKNAVPEYEQNLVNLIKDVRKDLKAPNLPVVIGELTGPWVEAPAAWATLRKAQAAAASRPEFKGNVLFVETHDFVRPAEGFPQPRPRAPRVRQRRDVFPGRRRPGEGDGPAAHTEAERSAPANRAHVAQREEPGRWNGSHGQPVADGAQRVLKQGLVFDSNWSSQNHVRQAIALTDPRLRRVNV